MSYTCLLMVLCKCACANLVSKANVNLINRTDLFICLHIIFQISFQNSKGKKSYCKFLGVRSELLLSIYVVKTSCFVPLFSHAFKVLNFRRFRKFQYLCARRTSCRVGHKKFSNIEGWLLFTNLNHLGD